GTGSGESGLVSDRAAAGSTVVHSVAALLTKTGSAVAADTVAWLVIMPPELGAPVITTVASAPPAIAPTAHVTVPLECEQLPWDGVAESKLTPAVRVSVSSTPVASSGPPLWAVSV